MTNPNTFRMINFDIKMSGGQCPVQINGTLEDGNEFYFRARGDRWSLGIDPQDAVGPSTEWTFIELYGEPSGFDAGWMAEEEALLFLKCAISLYANGYPSCTTAHARGMHKHLAKSEDLNGEQIWHLYDTATGDLLQSFGSEVALANARTPSPLIAGHLAKGMELQPSDLRTLAEKIRLLPEDQIGFADLQGGLRDLLEDQKRGLPGFAGIGSIHLAFFNNNMTQAKLFQQWAAPAWSLSTKNKEGAQLTLETLREGGSATKMFHAADLPRAICLAAIEALHLDVKAGRQPAA